MRAAPAPAAPTDSPGPSASAPPPASLPHPASAREEFRAGGCIQGLVMALVPLGWLLLALLWPHLVHLFSTPVAQPAQP